MQSFTAANFSGKRYLMYRPGYTDLVKTLILDYHKQAGGKDDIFVDIGCGPGQIAQIFAPNFKNTFAVDPSEAMINAAPKDNPSIQYITARAENLHEIENNSVDLIVGAQCSHWFDHSKTFPEFARVLKPRGALSFIGYGDVYFRKNPEASKVLHRYMYSGDYLGNYWEPGRKIIRNLLRDIEIPKNLYKNEKRLYFPENLSATHAETEIVKFLHPMTLETFAAYLRTSSAFHAWKEENEKFVSLHEGGEGDVIDKAIEDIRKVTESEVDTPLDLYFNSVIILSTKI